MTDKRETDKKETGQPKNDNPANEQPVDKDIQLPSELVELLKASESNVSIMTRRVDTKLAAQSEEYFATRTAPAKTRWSKPLWGLASAASVALIVAFSLNQPNPVSHDIYADFDGSGRVDIADVLQAAKQADTAGYSSAQLASFARRIVALDSPPRTSS